MKAEPSIRQRRTSEASRAGGAGAAKERVDHGGATIGSRRGAGHQLPRNQGYVAAGAHVIIEGGKKGDIAMLLALLAAAAVGASSGQPPTTITHPDWLKKPSPEAVLNVWPAAALAKGIGWRVVVACAINVHGALEQCRVQSESPTGLGFGIAALLLTPSFVMKPAMGPQGPVVADVTIPINFNSAGMSEGGGGGHDSVMLHNPTWIVAPTFADVGRAYPKGAGGLRGYVALHCRLSVDGVIRDCQTTAEKTRRGKGFDKAARSLVGRFRAKLTPELIKGGDTIWVHLPIALPDPESSEFQARSIGEPLWVVGLDPTRMAKLFPPAGGRQRVEDRQKAWLNASCKRMGHWPELQAASGDPDSLGYSESAVQMLSACHADEPLDPGGSGPVDEAPTSAFRSASTSRPRRSAAAPPTRIAAGAGSALSGLVFAAAAARGGRAPGGYAGRRRGGSGWRSRAGSVRARVAAVVEAAVSRPIAVVEGPVGVVVIAVIAHADGRALPI